MNNSVFKLNKEENRVVKTIFWRNMWILQGINWVRMQGIVVAWILQPLLRKIYNKDDDAYWDAMERHTVFFNTACQMSPFVLGLATSMEEENAIKPEEFDKESINGIKVALMGPLAGIGDSFFVGTFRIIATGISIGLCQQGNILGPILFLIAYNIPNMAFRWFGAVLGYKLGGKYISEAATTGVLASITKAAGIMGLIMVGALAAQNVNFTIAIAPTLGGQTLAIQNIFDQILLGLLPLTFIFSFYGMMKKKVNPIIIIAGVLVFSFVCAFFGIA